MKKLLVISSIFISLVGCSKEGDFKKAINNKISQTPKCLDLYILGGFNYAYNANKDDLQKLQDNNKDAYVIREEYDENGKSKDNSERNKQELTQLNALADAGLLTKSAESLPAYGWDKKQTGYYVFQIYKLTDAGKATAANVKVDLTSKALYGDNGQRIFCYATPEVKNIENYTEGETSGYHVAEIKYSYEYTNVADWTNKSQIKEAFPEIAKALNDTDKTRTIQLVKTNKGWSADL
jgi:hypothetical protein